MIATVNCVDELYEHVVTADASFAKCGTSLSRGLATDPMVGSLKSASGLGALCQRGGPRQN